MAPTILRGGPTSSLNKRRPGVAGKTIGGAKRHRKIRKDTIHGITKPAIRRLARRGGVKRISATIYDSVRSVLKDRLTTLVQGCVACTDYRRAKTVTVGDVLFTLRRLGQPIYGFDPETYTPLEKRRSAPAHDGDDIEEDD